MNFLNEQNLRDTSKFQDFFGKEYNNDASEWIQRGPIFIRKVLDSFTEGKLRLAHSIVGFGENVELK